MVVLGSTGSIGRQALDVVRANPALFRVTGLAAASQADELAAQADEFRPAYCGLTNGRACLPHGTLAYYGPEAPLRVVEAAAADVVVNAISGLAGLAPAFAALKGSGVLAMASKEPVVVAGHLLKQAAEKGAGRLIPVDSETTAVAQCLAAVPREQVVRVYISASGGPFLRRDPNELESVSPSEAVRHPRWAMGPKISVDSATLFNKGLEVIEVSRLFDLPQRSVTILVHPQSVAHAMAELKDGSIIAQLGPTDMRVPISQAMFWPQRAPTAPARLELEGLELGFRKPDFARWPCLRAALCAGAEGHTAPAAVSAADEELVRMYLAGDVTFGDIGRGLWAVIKAHRWEYGHGDNGTDAGNPSGRDATLAEIAGVDRWARAFSREWARRSAASERGRHPDQVGEDYIE